MDSGDWKIILRDVYKRQAYEMEDGVDYVPADTNVVFGHQFASIAGAGPVSYTHLSNIMMSELKPLLILI